MTETEFLNHVSQVFSAIEALIDRWASQDEADLESTRSGVVLEIECPGDKTLVVNAQTPMRQLWLASPLGAFHFEWQNDAWHDTRSGHDFWRVFHEQASQVSQVNLSPPSETS